MPTELMVLSRVVLLKPVELDVTLLDPVGVVKAWLDVNVVLVTNAVEPVEEAFDVVPLVEPVAVESLPEVSALLVTVPLLELMKAVELFVNSDPLLDALKDVGDVAVYATLVLLKLAELFVDPEVSVLLVVALENTVDVFDVVDNPTLETEEAVETLLKVSLLLPIAERVETRLELAVLMTRVVLLDVIALLDVFTLLELSSSVVDRLFDTVALVVEVASTPVELLTFDEP